MNSAHRRGRIGGALRCLALVSLATAAIACSYQASGSHTATGSVTSSGSVAFTDAGVAWTSGEPAVVFGVTALPGSREYSYVIVARPTNSGRGSFGTSFSGQSVLESSRYSANHTLEFGACALSVEHTAAINVSEDGLAAEKLLLQDKEVDLSLGRLILLDEWGIQGGWTQLATPLPSVTGAAEDLPASTWAKLEALALKDPKLADFLGR